MTRYVALLRGIGPGDPRMRNENLRAVCEGLGLRDVATVISSGNIIFEAGAVDAPDVETMLEAAWPRELGFTSTTIVRSHQEVADLVESRPFGELQHGRRTYLLVTFAKRLWPRKSAAEPPPPEHVEIVGATDRELFSVTDMTTAPPPDVMSWVERTNGRDVSSRTWLTVTRILKRMA